MSRSGIFRLVLFVFICVCIARTDAQSTVNWRKPLKYQSDELFPITIGKYGYPYIRVKINSDEFDLVWDTGNMSGLTLSTGLAERLNLPIIGKSKSYDSEGNVVGEYRTFNVGELGFFNIVRKDIRAHEFSHSALEGLVGPGFILDRRFTIDYINRTIAISSSRLPTESVDTTLSMVRSPKFPALILVFGLINDQKVLIEIDTGKSRTVVDPELAARLDLPKTSNGYRIDEVKIGHYAFEVASAKEKSFRGISDGLPEPIRLGIGSDILSEIILTVDYPRKILGLSK